MFAFRRRRKLTAEESEYINKRYEDPAIRIYLEVKREKYLYSSYVPWIQAMLIQYIPDAVLREKYWMEQVPLLVERTELEQAVTDRSKRKRGKRKYGRKKVEENGLQLEETQEQIVSVPTTEHAEARNHSLLEPVRIAWREDDREEPQTVNIIKSHRQPRSQVHETRSRLCTIS